MHSYGSFIAGQEQEGDRWTYCVRASSWIEDPRVAFDLKRSLELGKQEPDGDRCVVGRCAVATDVQLTEAIEAAHNAKDEWSCVPIDVKRQIALDTHDELLARADDLVDILITEGHPRKLAQWEISGVLRGGDPQTLEWLFSRFTEEMELDGRRLIIRRRPDGVVCVNPPQNAAGSNAAMGALAVFAGNTIVVKVPRSTPLSVMFFFRDVLQPVLDRHGAPAGVVNLVCSDSQRIIRSWLTNPKIDDIIYFGSSETGIKFGIDCVAQGKKPILELSGNDAVVVWKDADLDGAAAAMTECFFGSSQICMVPKRGIVHPEVADEFLETLLARTRDLKPGFPEDPDVVLSPVLKADGYFDYLSEAREAGAEILCGGKRINVDGAPASTGLFLEPSIVRVDGLEFAHSLSCVREETFFPLLPIVIPQQRPDDEMLSDVTTFLNGNKYGLRNSLWSSSDQVSARFVQDVTNGGMLKVNDSHIGFVSYLATHGGTGLTGGPFGEMNFAMLRTSHLQGVSMVTGDIAVSPLAPELSGARQSR